jgi:hypothetical protein
LRTRRLCYSLVAGQLSGGRTVRLHAFSAKSAASSNSGHVRAFGMTLSRWSVRLFSQTNHAVVTESVPVPENRMRGKMSKSVELHRRQSMRVRLLELTVTDMPA